MPNQKMPQVSSSGQSDFFGQVGGRRKTSTPSATAATSSRPSENAPGGTVSPRWRIATNADAQSTSVVPAAASGSQVRARVGRGVAVTVTDPA